MNYRHGFHAGNFADVHKHMISTAIIDYLLKKDAGFCVLDTHAGRGSYDLTTGQAARTGEYQHGIGKLWRTTGAPPLTARYLELVRAFNRERTGGEQLAAYPGSPRLARLQLRVQDRLLACELHPEESTLLKAEFRGDPLAKIHTRDAWEGLGGLVPPQEKRGLVLIDPPYEVEDELDQAVAAIAAALTKFPTGIFALWYPIKERAVISRFHRKLAAAVQQPILVSELCVWPDDASLHLNGSGMVIINPPWQLDEKLRAEVAWLWRKLSREEPAPPAKLQAARHALTWLRRD